ncbi:hypothetical protein [Elioraea rosea]|uniref:hypothetical protein n=1 Tax=Elioraea rosea TaxID=2492390 RepID=UPI0011840CD7|nr:hypothetical protein [Elioraea rosea]
MMLGSRRLLPVLLYATCALGPAALMHDERSLRDQVVSALTRLAFAVLLAQFLLAGRIRPVTVTFGLDTVMRLHRRAAYVAVPILLLHPFLYENVPDPHGVAEGSGIAASVLLAGLFAAALTRRSLPLRHETWRLMHGTAALAVAGVGTLHAIEAPADAHPALMWVWLGFASVAAATMLHVYLLRPLARRGRPWRVVAVRPDTQGVWAVTIEAVGHSGLRFEAGQFVWLILDRGPFSLREHAFSIASAPSHPTRLTILIAGEGDFTNTIGTLRPGARAWLDGPYGGMMPLSRKARGFVLIAQGAGVAPILSILREAEARGDRRPMLVIVGARREEGLIARAELAALRRTLDLTIAEVLAEPPRGWTGVTGKLDATVLTRFCREPQTSWVHVIYGRPAMLAAARAALAQGGVPARRILAEAVGYE